MATRLHSPLQFVALNSLCIGRQRYQLWEQMQKQLIDAVLLCETHLKPNEKFFTQNYHFYRTGRFPCRKAELP